MQVLTCLLTTFDAASKQIAHQDVSIKVRRP